MVLFFIGVDPCDLLDIHHIRPMRASKQVFIQALLKMIHGFIFQEIAFRCMDLYIIIRGLEVENILYWNDLDPGTIFNYYTLVLRRRMRGGF